MPERAEGMEGLPQLSIDDRVKTTEANFKLARKVLLNPLHHTRELRAKAVDWMETGMRTLFAYGNFAEGMAYTREYVRIIREYEKLIAVYN